MQVLESICVSGSTYCKTERSIPRSAVAVVATVVAVAGRGDRDDRIIIAIVEVLGCRRLVVVGIVVSDASETAGFVGSPTPL